MSFIKVVRRQLATVDDFLMHFQLLTVTFCHQPAQHCLKDLDINLLTEHSDDYKSKTAGFALLMPIHPQYIAAGAFQLQEWLAH